MLLVDPYLGAAQGNGLEKMAHTIISWVAYHDLLGIPCGGSKKKKKSFKLATWNVRTSEGNRPYKKTALISEDLKHYNVDIAPLRKT